MHRRISRIHTIAHFILAATAATTLLVVAQQAAGDVSEEVDPGTSAGAGEGEKPLSGAITGVITDPRGVALAGVTVKLICASTGVERSTLTDPDGHYRIGDLPPATDCVLRATYQGGGYATVVQDRIVVRAGRTTPESVQLFEERAESIIVSLKQNQDRMVGLHPITTPEGETIVYVQKFAPPPGAPGATPNVLGTRSVELEEVGQVTTFTAEFIEGLPLLGRNYRDVLTLAAGVVDPAGADNSQVMGALAESFSTVIDGVSNQDPLGATFLANLNTDAIEEVEIIVSGADASFRRAEGGFANITLPLGDGRGVSITFNTESYEATEDNPFRAAMRRPLSTFSIDVDTASYSNVRRYLAGGTLPPPDAVRIEELVNYFDYGYAAPVDQHPFSVSVETTGCPWAPQHRLMRVGLKGSEAEARSRPPANLVFLLDVSGSMTDASKLPLVKRSMRLLVGELNTSDTVGIVVYAGAAGVVLPPTPVSDSEAILDALEKLRAGGSTAGGAGIKLAYKLAREHFLAGGINRVILATDGDFNVGVSDKGSLARMITEEAKSGVFFSVLGFGMGNLKDDRLEKLANKGNGHYAYIDSLHEARKVLVEEVGSTLVTIAKDVKIQVEFNPARVHSYRLIGYENRLLRAEDFNDDRKDAGEIGAGHTVTALYEIVPVGRTVAMPSTDPLRYQRPTILSTAALESDEMLTVKVRYKQPDGDTSRLLQVPVTDSDTDIAAASTDTKFAAAVAAFGMLLRQSPHCGDFTYDDVERLAGEGLGDDGRGHRARFLELVRSARTEQVAAAPAP